MSRLIFAQYLSGWSVQAYQQDTNDINHKFENPKCWSYVFVQAVKARVSLGGGVLGACPPRNF